ncbi:MAG: hypothetical protein DCF22_09555 [Leptolyngbya sp.]|nr:MAG: hypothetical protein DCF22_09555 [Leptolyngbya sp.]
MSLQSHQCKLTDEIDPIASSKQEHSMTSEQDYSTAPEQDYGAASAKETLSVGALTALLNYE